jgi:hypothetical protein
MTEHIFSKDNEVGKIGEQIFKEYLDNKGITYRDVSDDAEYQKIDVDFVVNGHSGDVLVEVKNDTKIAYTGNIFYESISNVDYNTIGCFENTKADWIVICSEPNNTFYIVNAKFLKEYVGKNKNGLRYIARVFGSNSAGYLIPTSKIRNSLKIVKFGK